jgi:hypothetical protein
MNMDGGLIVEVDIERFFDTLDHSHLRDFLGQTGARWSRPTGHREMVESRGAGRGEGSRDREWEAPRRCHLSTVGQYLPP